MGHIHNLFSSQPYTEMGVRSDLSNFKSQSSASIDWPTMIHNNDYPYLIKRLQQKRPHLDGINTLFDDGTYPLHAAIRLGHSKMVSLLLHAGANPELKDEQGLTAYNYAFLSKDPLILKAMLPQNVTNKVEQALKIYDQTITGHLEAIEQIKFLQELIKSRIAIPKKDYWGVHGILLHGYHSALASNPHLDFSQRQRSKHGLTPLHCALLSQDEETVFIVLGKVKDQDLLAKDDKGMTPLHYAAMLGMSNSLKRMLTRCKKDRTFDINAIHPRLHYSLVNLAIAADQPKVLTLLCQQGAVLDNRTAGKGYSPGYLLSAKIHESDPSAISPSEYILAGYSILSLMTHSISPLFPLALMLASNILATSHQNKKMHLWGSALYWGGEIFSTYVGGGILAQLPWIKVGVDIYRVASIAKPCLEAISRSRKNLRYETEQAVIRATVNSVILGSTIYRTTDSLKYLRLKCQEVLASSFSESETLANNHPIQPCKNRKIIFGTTYVPGNPDRDSLSRLVNENQKEYADTWGLTHRVVDRDLLKNQCTVQGELRDCSPYWNKIKVLKDWLDAPTPTKVSKLWEEEWYIMADDDMVVTNMKIDPYQAIDQLRENRDTSVIVTKDVIPYTGNPLTSVNTGLLFVRKDEASQSLINQIWERRNTKVNKDPFYCPTLGVCKKQLTLHEQQALSEIIHEDIFVHHYPKIVNKVLFIISPRDRASKERGHIALNTFERSGTFMHDAPGWKSGCISYPHDDYHPEGKWRPRDWMGQVSGVPVLGRYCEGNKAVSEPRPIREEKTLEMLKMVRRKYSKSPTSN